MASPFSLGDNRKTVAAPQYTDRAVSCFESVPLELHGHRKKLRFIWTAIERYRQAHGLGPAQVRVLEVGCSNGRNISDPLARLGYQVTGIDIHAESIEYAKRATPLPNARFLCQNLSDLSPTEQFEIVVLSDVLEHVTEPAAICTGSMRHLVADGLVLISVPNGFGPYELEQRFLKRSGVGWLLSFVRTSIGRALRRPSSMMGKPVGGPAYNYDSGHVQFFHLRDFEQLLDRVGLEVVERANGALFGGTLTSLLVGRFRAVVRGSLVLADRLPQRWVTTWYYCCTARKSGRAGRASVQPGNQ